MIKNVRLWNTRIFLVVIAMTLFICCQKDDESSTPIEGCLHEQLQTTTIHVSLDEIPKVGEYLSHIGRPKKNYC